MTKETKNPAVSEPVETQEPTGSLEEAEVTTVEESGAVEEQPEKVSEAEKTTGKEQVKGVDLIRVLEKKLTPEELKVFKDTQAEFTKKSQSHAILEKENKTFKDYYGNLMKDPDFVALEKSKKAKAEKEKEPDFSKMSDEEIFNYTVDKRVQDKMSELEKKMDTKYGTYIQTKLVAEGNKLIGDFAEAKKIPVEDVKKLAKYAVEHKVPLEDAYKVAYADKIPEAARQDALDDLDLKKKANLELGSVPSGVAPIVPKLPTVRQAVELAEKQTGIKLKK